ncbi:hypothetical protein [Pseudoalteromonas 'SMAR']|uniref:hypothetical protein n=1 Tax=Pseudoalteromonas 'SMAR' TaxID=3416908 RepID=UPI003AF258A3
MSFRSLVVFIMATLMSFFSHSMTLTQLHQIDKGKFIVIGEMQSDPVVQITLKRNKRGELKQLDKSRVTWSKATHGLVIELDSPFILHEFNEQGINYRAEVYQLDVIPNTSAGDNVAYVFKQRVIRTDTKEVLETRSQRHQGQLLDKTQLDNWNLDLTAGTWSIPQVDYIAYPDAKIDAMASAEATFFAGGRGLMYHHDQHISEFKWRIKGNRLIVMYGRDNTKHILQLQIIKAIADKGWQVVMDARSDDGAPFIRSGFMLKHQGLYFDYDNTVGSWHANNVQYDYYQDHLYVPNVAHPGSKWAFTSTGEITREKLVHPVLGTVATCPDNSCYVSCEFKLKLLATEGDVLYVRQTMNAELEPQGALYPMGRWILKFDFEPRNGVQEFSHSWLNNNRIIIEEDGESNAYFFMAMPNAQGELDYLFAKGQPNNIQGHFSVVAGKLHLDTRFGTQIYEIEEFNRDSLDVCRYQAGADCSEGSKMTMRLNIGLQ